MYGCNTTFYLPRLYINCITSHITSLLVYYSARHVLLCHKRVTWPILVPIGAPITDQHLNSTPITDQHLNSVPIREYLLQCSKCPVIANVCSSRDRDLLMRMTHSQSYNTSISNVYLCYAHYHSILI